MGWLGKLVGVVKKVVKVSDKIQDVKETVNAVKPKRGKQ